MSEYVKLKRYNDWGVEYLAPDGEGLVGGYASASLGVLKGKEFAHIEWPDGTRSCEDVLYQKKRGTYDVEWQEPYFETEVLGATVRVSFEQVLVRRSDL